MSQEWEFNRKELREIQSAESGSPNHSNFSVPFINCHTFCPHLPQFGTSKYLV